MTVFEMGDPVFPQEFDWCLHLWQKKQPETSSLVDTSLLEAFQVHYINARYGATGMPCLHEQQLLKKYCDGLDNHSNAGGNHAQLIMPLIKNAATECLKWEHSSLDSLTTAMETNKNNSPKHSCLPSPDALKELVAAFAGSASEVSQGSDISKASDESTENSQVHANGTSSLSAFGFTSNRLTSSVNSSLAQSSSGTQRITSNLQERLDGSVTSYSSNHQGRLPAFLAANESHENNPSHRTSRASNVPQTTSFDLIDSSNVNFFSGAPKQSRPLEDCPRNFQNFAARQANNGSMGRGRGFYPWQKNAEALEPERKKEPDFRTASYQLRLNQVRQEGRGNFQTGHYASNSPQEDTARSNSRRMSADLYGNTERRSLGTRPGSVTSKFIPPLRRQNSDGDRRGGPVAYGDVERGVEAGPCDDMMGDPRLTNIDVKMVELIMNEVLDAGIEVQWDHIAGLQDAKATIQEVVVWPMLRPDIFTGLRGPPKGVLLFGPPGTGKTMIG
ncbi:P-loop containing nucleoside triphosphate hydrolase [Trinorchestia longiramus]|nr:P-loop containing nucleoside triphosphate hydrolase [Trinorchestia longiramus]